MNVSKHGLYSEDLWVIKDVPRSLPPEVSGFVTEPTTVAPPSVEHGLTEQEVAHLARVAAAETVRRAWLARRARRSR